MWLVGGLCASAAEVSARPAPDLAAGREAYVTNCARCHGDQGHGDGPDAARMIPRPRDFTTGTYKFRMTASGTPPTDEDLFHTISTGLAGTRMPGWEGLSEDTRWQLIAYLKSLAPSLARATPQPVASFGKDPGVKGADLAKGKQLYADLGCAACHGTAGRANGPSAKTLKDDWGQPIRAANLTHGWELRGGEEPKDLVARLMTGVDGTPMPSYADTVPAANLWQLAYYLRSIQEPANWSGSLTVVSAASLPTSPDDPAWAAAPRADLRLWSNVYVNGAVVRTMVPWAMVQAVATADTIAFRIAWDDPSEDHGTPPDQLALAFKPAIGGREVGSLQSWPKPGTPALDLIVWSAATGTAREAISESLDLPVTAEARPAQAQYADGRWSLVITRPRPTTATPWALVIWDGGNGETGRIRSVSSWTDLDLNHKEKDHGSH